MTEADRTLAAEGTPKNNAAYASNPEGPYYCKSSSAAQWRLGQVSLFGKGIWT